MTSRTSIRRLGEFGLIRMIGRIVSSSKKTPGLMLGIGDDAAVFKTSGSKLNVITVDAMTEGIHFDLRYTGFRDLGWKAVAVNLSDLAAMGAEPKWLLVHLTIPERIKAEDISELYRGISACSNKFSIRVIGGNISRAKREFVVCITALGQVHKNRLLKRSSARSGDVLAVTGDLGASHAGLRSLQWKRRFPAADYIRQKHIAPVPRVDWIRQLLDAKVKIHACIDISDGLSSDLKHLCEASKAGAEVELDRIPVHPQTRKTAEKLHEDIRDYVLNGGEEYELLMALAPAEFLKAKKVLGKQITAIGRINRSGRITLADGTKRSEIMADGFTHF